MTTLQNPNTTAATAAVNTTDASPDRGGCSRAILALLLAGALLQRHGHKIDVAPGERYPQAVRRIVQAMPLEQRLALRSEVAFLMETDLRYSPFSTLSKYQQPPD